MKIKSYLAAAGLCLLPMLSHAGIVYQWSATNDQVPLLINIELEFEQSTIDSGAFAYTHEAAANFTAPLNADLFSLRYSFPGMSYVMQYSSERGFSGGDYSNEYGSLNLDLRFDRDGFLTGSFAANDVFSHIILGSSGREFTVIDANSDEGMPNAGCGFPTNIPCQGATGMIRQAMETKIPEPASLALLAIGVVGLASTRRRKVAAAA